MDGLTVSKSNAFLNSGSISELKNLPIDRSTNKEPLAPGDKTFADTLNQAIGSVNELQKASDRKMEELATGRTDNVADVMIAAEKADIALRVMVQVRNKIVDAYNEIMKMPV